MIDLQRVQQAVEAYREANPGEDDHSLICEAVWAAYGDDADLSENFDDGWVRNGNDRLYWLLPENEGDETITVLDGVVRIGTIDGITRQLNQEYCEKHGGAICPHCGEMSHKTAAECSHCGHYMDGSGKVDELTLPEDYADMLQDGGSEKYLWLLKRRLETHETPKNHTYLFIELDLMPEEGRYRGTFEKPEEWCCSIRAVNVGMAGKSGAASVQSCMGMDAETWEGLPHTGKAEALLETGISACLWQNVGVSPRRLLDAAVKEMVGVSTMGGFYLDRRQNAVGSTGWDFMAGQIDAGIKRHIKKLRQV